MPTRRIISSARSRISLPFRSEWSEIISMICSSTVMIGFRDVIGSWKIMAISRPRMLRSSASVISRTFCPLNQISPLVISPGGDWISCRIASAVVVLPAPVSPTNPSALPSSSCMLRWLTAWTTPESVSN